MRRVANAQIVLSAPVEIAAIPAQQGVSPAGFSARATPRKTVAAAGVCTVAVAAIRTVPAVKPVTGRSVLGVTGRGAAGRIKPTGGRCTLGLGGFKRATATGGIFAGAPVYLSAWTGQETTMAAPPPIYTIDVICGQPFQVTLPIVDGGGVPVPAAAITSARVQVRPDWRTNRVLHEWSTTVGNVTVGSGGVTLTGTTAQTVDWQFQWPATAVWDLQVVDTSGVAHRLTSAGPIRLNPAITR